MQNGSSAPTNRYSSQAPETGGRSRPSDEFADHNASLSTYENPAAANQHPAGLQPAALHPQAAVPPFICISSALHRLLLQARIASAHTQLATIEGEPGSGKHLFAQTMHQQSVLSQLSFRRADAREWLASEADTAVFSGILYLDRVDLLASTGQGLLLNFIKSLQESAPSRFLLLASVQTPLRLLASQGNFLPDLAFRLSAVRFSLPPLRDHREDIAPITQGLLDRICSRYRQPAAVLASGTLPRLLQHSWPGNVRELASTLECAILESKTGVIRPSDLVLEPHRRPTSDQQPQSPPENPFAAQNPSGSRDNQIDQNNPPPSAPPSPESLTLNAAIHRHIQYVLELNRGNKLRAARQLDISRSTLYRILAGESLASNPPQSSPKSDSNSALE